jgi:hypothetical protein
VGERRKKTPGGNNDGKAAGKSRRSRKVRPGAEQNRDLDPGVSQDRRDGHSGPDGADTASTSSMKSTPPTAEESGPSPQALLPGEFYQRAGRWWWRVKLPGEDKATARSLKSPGAKAAAEDRPSAEKIAFAMWEHALQDDAARQIKLESTEKIERLKAQFLDKVRHFTELVETANAKIEMEAKARTEAETKLAQALQAAGAKVQDQGQRAPEAQPPAPQTAPPTPAAEMAPPRIADCGLKKEPADANPKCTIRTPQSTSFAPAVVLPLPQPQAPAGETPPVEIPTGVCDCCGATGIALSCLTPIDSGQSLCPRCLTALRADITRLDSDPQD